MADGTLLVQVPVDDGAIRSAFEMLDAQMDAWLQAMKRAEQALAVRTMMRSAKPDASCEPSADEPAVETAPVTVSEAVQPVEPLDSSAPATQLQELEPELASAPASEPAASVAAVEPPKTAAPVRQGITAIPATPRAEDPAPTAAGPALNKNAEDEALLASLDEETAKAIRLMRRMCMNSKSVKELLAEYQAKKGNESPASAATAKKSWFRRK